VLILPGRFCKLPLSSSRPNAVRAYSPERSSGLHSTCSNDIFCRLSEGRRPGDAANGGMEGPARSWPLRCRHRRPRLQDSA
jgi:hypothetical protein